MSRVSKVLIGVLQSLLSSDALHHVDLRQSEAPTRILMIFRHKTDIYSRPSPRPQRPRQLDKAKLDPEEERLFEYLIRRELEIQSLVIRTHGTTEAEWRGYRCVIATIPDDLPDEQLDEFRALVPFTNIVHTTPGSDYSCSFLMVKDDVYNTFDHGYSKSASRKCKDLH